MQWINYFDSGVGLINKIMICERCGVLIAKGETHCLVCKQLIADELKEFYVLPGSKKHEKMPEKRFRIFLYKLSMRLDKWYYRVIGFCCHWD